MLHDLRVIFRINDYFVESTLTSVAWMLRKTTYSAFVGGEA